MRSDTSNTRTSRSSHRLLVAAALAIAGHALSASTANAQFSYPNFSNLSGLNMLGSSLRSGNSLIVAPAQTRVAGAAWYTGAKQNVAGGFDMTVSFRINDVLGTGADGFAFVIQNSGENVLGGTGGAMGYGSNIYFDGPTPRGIQNSLAVEFDMWNNQNPAGDWADLDSNHVSIQSRGLLANNPSQDYSLGAAPVLTSMSDGAVHTARVLYVPGTMRVYVDNLTTPLVTSNIDLGSLLSLDAGTAWVGLTAATGGATDVQSHEILSWNMAVSVPAPGMAGALAGVGLFAMRRRRR
ncbi:MAG: hypothetical protein KF745_09830 [Phycisphaeraceae bacterium]|nr:hypothetical protein [Phycisphaeraceae bacterium]